MFSLGIFLYVYYAFLFLWAVFSLAVLFHLYNYGFKNLVTFFSMFLYAAASVMILGTSFYYIMQVDWNQKIVGFDANGGQMWPNNE